MLFLTLSALCLTGCGGNDTTAVASAVGIELTDAVITEKTDSHGGFHGDGTLFCVVDCSAAPAADQIMADGHWRELPLTEPLTGLIYGLTQGDTVYGPLVAGEDGRSLFPPVERGWYLFLDRHSEASDVYDDAGVLGRYSYNFTLALYDADTDMLYYCEVDM